MCLLGVLAEGSELAVVLAVKVMDESEFVGLIISVALADEVFLPFFLLPITIAVVEVFVVPAAAIIVVAISVVALFVAVAFEVPVCFFHFILSIFFTSPHLFHVL
jgi:hypothetical protein